MKKLREYYDVHWQRAFLLWLSAWGGGFLIERAATHHGSWEWLGWVVISFSYVMITYVTAKMRKAAKR